MIKLTRRKFITLAAVGAAAAATGSIVQAASEGTSMKKTNEIPKRPLGKTGEMLSMLCFGGFHLIESMPNDVERMIKFYLDSGGNFIETAPSYGDSEVKIGQATKSRRAEFFLSTKTVLRSKKDAAIEIDQSLKRLNTDHIDNLFIHNVQTTADLDAILAPDGAIAAAEDAKKAGKLRYISITGHTPEVLLKALQSYPFDATMEWMNYYDYFNFPVIFDEMIPYCRENGIGMIAMKPLADGLLYRNARQAFRWAWSLPITSVATGMNTMDMVKKNIKYAKSFQPMSETEKQEIYRAAPEFANYVCRRCEKCTVNAGDLDVKAISVLEGYYDRQMYNGRVPNDTADYALRERLKFWFGNQDLARERYAELDHKVPKNLDAKSVTGKCGYGINVPRKLRIAAWKLTGDVEYLKGV